MARHGAGCGDAAARRLDRRGERAAARTARHRYPGRHDARRSLTSTRRAVVALAALLVVAGCRDLVRRAFSPPRAAFRRIELEQLGLGGGRVAVMLELYNPNGYALTATGARYHLFVDDSFPVGDGTSTDTVRVAAHDSALVRLPLDVQWSQLRAAGVDVLRAGSARYRIAGDVDVATPVGSYAVPLEARGEARLGLRLQ